MQTLQEYVHQAFGPSTKVKYARTRQCALHKKTQIYSQSAHAAGMVTRHATVTYSRETKNGLMSGRSSRPIIKPLGLTATQRQGGRDVVKLNFTMIGCVLNSRLKIMHTWLMMAHYLAWKIYMHIFPCSKTSHYIVTHGAD
jgi:hypothetical protein